MEKRNAKKNEKVITEKKKEPTKKLNE